MSYIQPLLIERSWWPCKSSATSTGVFLWETLDEPDTLPTELYKFKNDASKNENGDKIYEFVFIPLRTAGSEISY